MSQVRALPESPMLYQRGALLRIRKINIARWRNFRDVKIELADMVFFSLMNQNCI